MACYAGLVSLIRAVDGVLLPSPAGAQGSEALKSARDEAWALKETIQLMDIISCYSGDELLDGCSSGCTTAYRLGLPSLKLLDALEPFLSTQFPVEYKLWLFSSEHDGSFRELVKWRVDPTDGRIRRAVAELDRVLGLLQKKPLSLSVVDLKKGKQQMDFLGRKIEEEKLRGDHKSKLLPLGKVFPATARLVSDTSTLADEAVWKLKESIKRLDRNRSSSSCQRLNALEGEMREAACKLQDSLESNMSTQSEYDPVSLELLDVDQVVKAFIRSAKELRQAYLNELCNTSFDGKTEEGEKENDHFHGKNKNRTIGLLDEANELKNLLTSMPPCYGGIYTIVGMAGIGKTALAREVFEDPSISNHFDCRAWVTMGPKRELSDIVRSILAQVDPDTREIIPAPGDEETKMVQQALNGSAFLIVLDDVWDAETLDDFIVLLPNNDNRSRLLVTTRLRGVSINDWCRKHSHEKRFMSKEESWKLLRGQVLGDQTCPPTIEKYGQVIAEDCDGLPLTIITVAHLLSRVEQTAWGRVAKGESSLFSDAYDQMSESLFQSYRYLPQHLKACFLYMGGFPKKYEFSCTKLTQLWSCEELLEPVTSVSFEKFVTDCLHELFTSHLIMRCNNNYNYKIKTWRLHSAYWHMCTREARHSKFSQVINRYADGITQSTETYHRLCIHNNVLLGIKDMYKLVSSNLNARSLLCTGPYHRYPVPICSGLRLLRVLDAHTIRIYEFPSQILKLIHLRYLAITFNGNLPPSISKLRKLQCLIVRRHLSTKTFGSRPHIPVEIWDMKELKHLQVVGDPLVDPPGYDAVLPLLTALLDVSTDAFTGRVLGRVRNLMKLGFRIQLGPDTDGPPSFFEHISQLGNLQSLKCVVVHPSFVFATQPQIPSDFSSGLNKLSLSGLGFPWEDMGVIENLPNLRVLKLRCYAVRGPKWETGNGGFGRLDSLVIEDTDLVYWTAGDGSFDQLRQLSIKHCYKLEVIPEEFSRRLFEIHVVDCNPLAESCARKIRDRM